MVEGLKRRISCIHRMYSSRLITARRPAYGRRLDRQMTASTASRMGDLYGCIHCLGLADGRPGHSIDLGWMAVLRSGRDAISGLRSEPLLSLTTWPATA